MPKYELTCGIRKTPLRMVAYGPEGIGKSTFAAQMPGAVFVDVEGGTNQLPVVRLPKPSSWTMLMEEVRTVRDGGVPDCQTLVIDTADAAEVLCIRHVCAKNNWDGLESAGYGKGYTYVEEEFGRLLDLLTEVTERGRNAVLLSHAIMRKFERPDESGAYDRFELKLSKKVAPKVKEWCDLLLFLDYKTFVTTDKNGKARASGGERVIRTTHAPTWDAKNRFGLPDVLALDGASAEQIASLMAGGESLVQPDGSVSIPADPTERIPPQPASQAESAGVQYPDRLAKLSELMAPSGVTDEELRGAVAAKGYFPFTCAVADYPTDFADWLVTVWDSLVDTISELRQIPFDTNN